MHPNLRKHMEVAAAVSGLHFERMGFLDFETRSEVDIKKAGAHVYASDPSTEIMCASFAFDDKPIQRWLETDDVDVAETIPELEDPSVLWCFHNAEFEPLILRYCTGIIIPETRVIDSAAIARHASLPGGLDDLGKFYGQEKDMEGNRIMLKLSKPRRPSKANPDKFWRPDTKPEDFERCYDYCDRDVFVSRYAMRRMPPMSEFEQQVFWSTMRMNNRGIPVDRPAAHKMLAVVEAANEELSDEIRDKYGFTLSQVKDIAAFIGQESAAKDVLRDLLKDPDLPEEHREVAEKRTMFAKGATAKGKINAFIKRSDSTDQSHCVKNSVIYGGAERTLRFSGAGVQPQNMVRGLGPKQDEAFEALDQGMLQFLFDDAIHATISGMLRGLVKDPLRNLLVGDYAQIEARMLAWLAGDKDLLTAFKEGRDPYRMMAAKIYHKAIDLITQSERFMGKQCVLGCGYGLGKHGFRSMLDKTYDVQIEEDEAETIVVAYRKNAPKVVKLWRRIDNALKAAHKAIGKRLRIAKTLDVMFLSETEFHLILPSGRRLRYYEVERKDKMANGRMQTQWSCYGRIPATSQYGRVKIYGGKLTGHIVQSMARDVICNAIVELDRANFPLILTVHDENVTLDEGERFDEFVEIMETPPAWLIDFPLKVDAFQTARYRKD